MLHVVALSSLVCAFGCAAVIVVDEIRHPQEMTIMNVVWPVSALYASVFALWAYFRRGRRMSRDAMHGMPHDRMASQRDQQATMARPSPTFAQTALAVSHCGAGCAIADVIAEFTVFGLGLTVFGMELYASYVWDLAAAWIIGIFFQYFAIKPMRNLSFAEGFWAAIKADTLSILTFQIGMYGWMALVFFKFFPHHHLHPNEPTYWFMMQIAMLCGFITALPVNWFLVNIGWKETMG